MDPVVIAFGGSVLAPEEPDPEWLRKVAKAIREWSEERRVFVVVGGGRTARRSIHLARESGASEEDLDRVGIQATRLNAQILLAFLRGADVECNADVPLSVREGGLCPFRAVVMGGTTPGHSTDHVAAELAHECHADRLVIATNVDGVYDKDPRAHDDATRFETMSYGQLQELVGPDWTEAGMATIVDPPAAALLAESNIETLVLDGMDLGNVGKAVQGETVDGTRITGDA